MPSPIGGQHDSAAHAGHRRPAWALHPTLVLLTVLGLGATGCSDICNRNSDDPPTAFRDGITNASGSDYMTSEPTARYLDFPSGKRYRLFHGLTETPSLIVPYVAFSATPLNDESGFSVSPGNQTVVRTVTPQYIEVENDTCTDFYLRVAASAGGFTEIAPVDAGADGG